jgi:two-component system sensor histidine kinase ChvG
MLDKLVENAVDFTPPDGRIEIGLRTSRDACTLAVANDGPPAARDHAGQPLRFARLRPHATRRPAASRTRPAHRRLIAEAHGGTIEACDLPDARGVEFLVMLPRAH